MKQKQIPYWKTFEHILCDAWRLDHIAQPNMHLINRLVHNLKTCIADEQLVLLYRDIIFDPYRFDVETRSDILFLDTMLSLANPKTTEAEKQQLEVVLGQFFKVNFTPDDLHALFETHAEDLPKHEYLLLLMSQQAVSAADIVWHFGDAVFDFAELMAEQFPNPLFSDYHLVSEELRRLAEIAFDKNQLPNVRHQAEEALQNLLIRCSLDDELYELGYEGLSFLPLNNHLGFDLSLTEDFINKMSKAYPKPKGVGENVS